MSAPHDDALAILHRLRDAGHLAYFAGGCVRDSLLGLEPTDWDIATDAPPARVRSIFTNTQAVGAAFGVILVHYRQSIIEVATFRADSTYKDGRRPESVHFTTAEVDAQRRDFTINGLFFDPIENQVIDYVGGQNDLKEKRLRAIGNPNERFAEDHLRLLRAVRFAARFNLEIEPTTTAAIIAHAHQLPRISPERIADELRRTLTVPTRTLAWPMLWNLSLIPPLFRFLPTPGNAPFDSARSLFLSLQNPSEISFSLALAAATLDYQWQRASHPSDIRPWLEKPEISKATRAMRQTLKLSNEETEDLENTLTSAAPLLADNEPTLAKKKRFLATPTAANTRSLLQAIAAQRLSIDRITKLQLELTNLEKTNFAPTPFITGDDLTTAGLSPGPIFKQALEAAYDAQLEDRARTKEEAMKLALAIAKKNEGAP